MTITFTNNAFKKHAQLQALKAVEREEKLAESERTRALERAAAAAAEPPSLELSPQKSASSNASRGSSKSARAAAAKAEADRDSSDSADIPFLKELDEDIPDPDKVFSKRHKILLGALSLAAQRKVDLESAYQEYLENR